MQIDIATLFPEMCDAVLQESILGRAQKSGAISVQCWNIRDYTLNKHKRVDDVPYGGGRFKIGSQVTVHGNHHKFIGIG